MEVLPVELRQAILQRMDLPTLKAIRLASKSWAFLGEDYLMSPNFSTLPHRDDIHRLLAISKHPRFSSQIQALFVNLGEIDEYHARHNTYFIQYMRSSGERSETLEKAWSVYNQLKLLKERYLGTSCDVHLLTEAFSSLPNLRSVSVSLTISPFETPSSPDVFREIWLIPSTRLLPRVATTERFTNILTALASSRSSSTGPAIKSLSHDRLPFEFFAQKPLIINLLTPAFTALTSLSLVLDYSEMPNDKHAPQAFQNLSRCLRCCGAADLRSLRLGFQGRKKITISPLLCSLEPDDDTDENGGFSFPKLETLALEGVTSTETELARFLVRQKALRWLRLGGEGTRSPLQPANGGLHLRDGSFDAMFKTLEKEMHLGRIEVMGDLVGLQSGEKWFLNRVEDARNLKEYVID